MIRSPVTTSKPPPLKHPIPPRPHFLRVRKIRAWSLLAVCLCATALHRAGIAGPPEIEGRNILTLEAAYDRAMVSDQSIRIAYIGIRKSRLLPWEALTRYEPKIVGSFGWEREHESRRGHSGSGRDSEFDGSTFETKRSIDSGPGNEPQVNTDQFDFQEDRRDRERISRDYRSERARSASAAIILEQPLLDLTVIPAWRAGKISIHAAQLECRFVVREVLYGVARAYYAVLKSEGVVAVDAQTVELAQKQLDLSQKRFDAGETLRTDVSRARVNLVSAQRKRIESATTLRIARNSLANILNLKSGTDFRLVEPANASKEIGSLQGAIERAFQQRDDLKASALAIDLQREKGRGAAASFLPRVTAQLRGQVIDQDGSTRDETRGVRNRSESGSSAGTGIEIDGDGGSQTGPISSSFSTDSQERFSGSASSSNSRTASSWEALIAVEIPMWGKRTIDLRKSSMQTAEAMLERDKLTKKIQEQVNEAWLQVQSIAQTVEALRTEVEAANQNYEDLQLQYGAGSVTSLDILLALRDLNTSRTLLISESFGYEVALRNLQRVTGDFQRPRVESLNIR